MGGLDAVSGVLDAVDPTHSAKPLEQPAQLLPWLYLGGLSEARNTRLLVAKGIDAVLNTIHWWELESRLPPRVSLSAELEAQGIAYGAADAEDQLLFDVMGQTWPEAERFLATWHAE